jgi:hypothetical protein
VCPGIVGGVIARRVAIFVGIVLLLGLAAAAIAPPAQRAPDLTPPRDAGESTEAQQEPGVVTASLSPDTPAREGRIEAKVGDRVRIQVASDKLDTVTLGALRSRTAEPGAPALLKLTAAEPGRYPITLQGARMQVGTLEVR